MRNSGFTLIELLVVITIIGILAISLGFSFEGWQGRYKVESRIKDIESDLNKARSRAMQRNRMHFFSLDSATQYTVFEDTDPAPDGDSAPDVALDTVLPTYPKTIDYDLNLNGAVPAGETISFDTRGIMQPNRTICIFTDFDGDGTSDVDPDYDCLVISQTRVSMGKLNSQVAGDCGAAICDRK